MKIKAVFFDLDDTLFDTQGQIGLLARKDAIKAMQKNGLRFSEKKALNLINRFLDSYGPKAPVFEMLAKRATKKPLERIVLATVGLNAYYASKLPKKLRAFDGTIELLQTLRQKKTKLFLVTLGHKKRQRNKIRLLGLNRFFDRIEFHDPAETDSKETHFQKILRHYRLKPSDCISVGDRLHSEIRICNRLGMFTVHMKKGRYANTGPANEFEEPDYQIKHPLELLSIIPKIENKTPKNPRIVLLGGGTGLSNLLTGLKKYTHNLTAIVTVTDSGKSSGILRNDFGMPPPGDIRNCLVALSTRQELLGKLFQHRFSNGTLQGHSFGNLFLAALTQLSGSFEKAVAQASEILAIQGKVVPSTLVDAQIGIRLQNGHTLIGEDTIVGRDRPVHLRAPISRAFLVPSKTPAFKGALEAIRQADLIVLGPGCLYTSVISNLLVHGIPNEIAKSKVKTVFVCNIMTQQGQTDSLSASQHIKAIASYLKKFPDFCLINTKIPPKSKLRAYEKEHAFMVKLDKTKLQKIASKLIFADLLQKNPTKKTEWNRRDYLCHDADKLAKAIMALV